jgi:hypothetical protein
VVETWVALPTSLNDQIISMVTRILRIDGTLRHSSLSTEKLQEIKNLLIIALRHLSVIKGRSSAGMRGTGRW